MLLMLCLVSIGMISCKKDPIKEATERYIKANSIHVHEMTAISSYLNTHGGNKIKFTVNIIDWNATPIDTITIEDFYDYELKSRIKKANEYKLHTLHSDSSRIARYRKDIRIMGEDYFKSFLDNALQDQKRHMAVYKNMVDNINLIKEKQHLPENSEPVYLVYEFTERLVFTHPTSKEKVEREYHCYSYANLKQQAVTYVDEGEDSYTPKFEELISPFVEQELHEEDELELI